MNRLTLCLLFLMSVLTVSSQKVYFVYLQSETDQPFFIKMNEKIFSSSASGYLILSKMRDSIYNINVGFPQNKWPEQNFSVIVNKKDHGYLLKYFDGKGWGLFDLQTSAVQMASANEAKVIGEVKIEKKEVSAFTDILSKAADDPSLKEKPVQLNVEQKKTEVVVPELVKNEERKAETKDSLVTKPLEIVEKPAVKKEEPKSELIGQPVMKTEEMKIVPVESYKKSWVTKISESSTTEGFGLVFIDSYSDGANDTIRIIVPTPKPVLSVIKEEPKEEKKFLELLPDTTKKVEEKTAEIKPIVNEQSVSKSSHKNNCADIATESDFLKLRKKMAAETSDDRMVDESRKYFKTKCFTVTQVKNLGSLFLNDAGKYKFFDAAYVYVSDIENFTSLQAGLKDEYYINRFRAMLRN